jgi:hypothetical protein
MPSIFFLPLDVEENLFLAKRFLDIIAKHRNRWRQVFLECRHDGSVRPGMMMAASAGAVH